MKKILKTNTWLLLLLVVVIGYMLNFIDLDIVMNDSVWQQHLNEKYDKSYNLQKMQKLAISLIFLAKSLETPFGGRVNTLLKIIKPTKTMY